MGPVAFGVLAALLVASALGVILAPSPIRSALSLIVTLFLIAVTFVLLDAQLVAALQVVVYAGAIMVLFLFVIMLLNLQTDVRAMAHVGVRLMGGGLASLFLLSFIRFLLHSPMDPHGIAMAWPVPADFGSTEKLAETLFTRFLFAFEITSVLLLVAIIGAVVLAKQRLE